MPYRSAFTLAEVLFALLVLALGILSIILLFPIGIRSQEQVRYQMYASIKAMELSDALAQHTKNFSDRVHEMTGDLSGERIVAGAVYGSYARFDAETVWAAGGQNGVYPVPVEIARRLDSPGGEIQQVLDQGGYLFYHDPRPVRGFSMTEATNPAGAKTAPELQRLIFAVVGAPQQNALPQHPCLQGPSYQLYPFPPHGPRISAKLGAKVGSDGEPKHKYIWNTTDVRVHGHEIDQWESMNWEVMASRRFKDSPWRDGLLAFRNLCYFGWTPFEFKMRRPDSGPDPDPDDGIDFRQDNRDNIGTISTFPGKMGVAITATDGGLVPNYWANGDYEQLVAGVLVPMYWKNDLSSRGASYLPGYEVLKDTYTDDSGRLTVMDAFKAPGPGLGPMTFEAFVNNPGYPSLPAQSRFDTLITEAIGTGLTGPSKDSNPANWKYKELGSYADPRLPSLQQRYLYRWLALKLWRDVTVGSSLAGMNPLVDPIWAADGSYPDAVSLHPARVLALSHLADAAMRVGGMRLPMWETLLKPDEEFKPADFLGSNKDAIDRADRFPGSETDGPFPSPKTPQGECLPADVLMAKTAHENCLRWAIAYANRFPHDNLVPRPGNRQVMTDRALWQWDLFDSAGNALRANTPNTWQGSAMTGVMPGYKVLPRPGIVAQSHDHGSTLLDLPRLAPGFQVLGGQRRYSSGDYVGMDKWFERMTRSNEPTFDVQNAARARRYALNQPFAPQNRVRQLVYWAADWKSYEDSESAPSAPHGAEILDISFLPKWHATPSPSASAWNDFDPSEGPLIWFGRDRKFSFSALFGREGGGESTDPSRMHPVKHANREGITWSKQLGSIRNYFDDEGLNHTFGLFGADRDGNGIYRNGSVKSSVRLRALEVARFNFYDPVVWCHLRK